MREQMRHGTFRKWQRVALTGLVAGGLAVAAAGCAAPAADTGGGTTAPEEPLKIAVFYYNGSPFGVSSLKGAQAEGEKLGVEIVGFNGDNVAQTQAQQIQDATTSGQYDGFVVFPLDPTALKAPVDAAVAAGIKVVTTDYTFGSFEDQLVLAPTPGLLTTVGASLADQQVAFADSIKQACAEQVGEGNDCNVAFMIGLDNYPTDTVRIDYLKKEFATGPIKLITTPPGMYDTPTSQKVALTFFQSNPDIDVFDTFGDQMAAGAFTALDQLGIVPGKDILVLSSGASKEFIEAMQGGTGYSSVPLYPASEAAVGVQAIVDSFAGKDVPTTINVVNGDNRPAIIDAAFLKSHPDFAPEWSLN